MNIKRNIIFSLESRKKDGLKELGELAGLDEPVRESYYRGNHRVDEVSPKYSLLSTHAGRRTFICNALSLGIPAHVVMKWTGHSDYKAMKPYVDVSDQVRVGTMEKFNSAGKQPIPCRGRRIPIDRDI